MKNLELVKDMLQNYDTIKMKLKVAADSNRITPELTELGANFEHLNICINALELEMKAVIELFYIQKLTLRKTARVLGYVHSTVKNKINKAILLILECY